MNKPHVNFEEYVARMEASIKEKVVLVPYIKGKVIVDFGAGSGGLGVYLKSIDPSLTIYAVEKDPAMIELLSQNPAIDKIFGCLGGDDMPKADTIIFNSVIHEVYSYSEPHLRPAAVQFLFQVAVKTLKPGGRIIIRDGFKDLSLRDMTAIIKDPDSFDIARYLDEYRFGGKLTFNAQTNQIGGRFTDVKEFLNKLTWGMKSFEREIQEQINCFTEQDYRKMLSKAGMEVQTVQPCLQPSYFFYLNKVAEINEVWNTHLLVVAQKP